MKTIKLVSLSVVMLSAASVLGADKPAPAPAPAPAAVAAPAPAAAAPAVKATPAPAAAAPAAKPASAPVAANAPAAKGTPAPAAAAPAAAPAAPPAPPTPAPELTAFAKNFEGSWKCDSKFPAGAMGPGSPEMTGKSTVSIKKDLNGFWYKGLYEESRSPRPSPG